MEAQFATKGITQQLTKYHYIVGSLAPEIGREVRDVIVTVRAVAPFDTLKERLVSRTSLTESQRMQKLLSLEPLGDQKPSQLLRRIEQLADKTGNDDPILQEIFLTHLPVAVQLVLKSHPDKSTEQLASLADSLIAVTPEASLPGSFSTIAPVAANIDTIASLRSELEDLKCQFSLRQKTGKFLTPLYHLPFRHTLLVPCPIWQGCHQMLKTLLYVGKRFPRLLMATSGSGNNSHLLFVTDRTSGQRYLVDSGAEVSVLPATHIDRQTLKKGLPLRDASGSAISTFGKCTLSLHFGLRKNFNWTFILADVSQPIIGADFFREHGLLIDLIDCKTQKHPAAAFLLTFLTWKHSTSTIFLRHTIGITPFSETSPNSLFLKWLTRHQHMVSSTALLLLADQPSQRLVDFPLQSWLLLRRSSTISYSLVSSNLPPVPGIHHYIWCPRSQEHGVPAVIIVLSTTSPHLTDIPSLTSKTSEHHCVEPQSSPR